MEKAMATHSSTFASKIPWTEELGRLQSMGSRRVRHYWETSLSLFTFLHWRRRWQRTPVFLPGESQGWEPGGLPSMESHRVRHDWRDLAAAGGLDGNEPACSAGDLDLIPGSGRPPQEGNGLLTSVVLPGEFHGQRSLVGYIPWDRKESDMTEQLILSLFTFMENREYLKADLRVKKSEYPFDALFELF